MDSFIIFKMENSTNNDRFSMMINIKLKNELTVLNCIITRNQ